MRANDFITESTDLFVDGGDVIAVKSSLGRHNGSIVTMKITKDEWEAVKNLPANTETMDYDLATAESIIRDWTSRGAKIKWKTAAEFNADARAMQNHRFRNDPEVAGNFDAGIQQAQDQARATSKSNLRTVDEDNNPMVVKKLLNHGFKKSDGKYDYALELSSEESYRYRREIRTRTLYSGVYVNIKNDLLSGFQTSNVAESFSFKNITFEKLLEKLRLAQ